MSLRFETACEARKLTGKANHAMARHNDGDGISPIRRPDRPGGLGISQLVRQLAVAPSLSKWNAQQRFPHLVLEGGASHVQRKGERLPFAREVLLQLTLCFSKNRVIGVFYQLFQ